jgi:hypothetical protein
MGKAGYLPDISGRFSQWTGHAIRSLASRDYDNAIGALNNMNALLDEEHRITVSTQVYNEKVMAEKFFQCNYCTMLINEVVNKGDEHEHTQKVKVPTEVNYADIHIFSLRGSYVQTVLLNTKDSKVWRCPTCKNLNKLINTMIIESVRERPFYIRVIPDPPVRTISNRIGFDRLFKRYFNNYFEELENALMNYRVEYIKEHGEDMADLNFDKGDKS